MTEHRLRVVLTGSGWWRARCSCGWRSGKYGSRVGAELVAGWHKRKEAGYVG